MQVWHPGMFHRCCFRNMRVTRDKKDIWETVFDGKNGGGCFPIHVQIEIVAHIKRKRKSLEVNFQIYQDDAAGALERGEYDDFGMVSGKHFQ